MTRSVMAWLSALFCALLVAPSVASAHGDAPHHVALWYTTEPGDLGTDTEWVVAYQDRDGKPLDWFFDGLLITSIELQARRDPGASAATVADYKEELFDLGGLAGLDDTVGRLRQELDDPTYTLPVYLESCYYTGPNANDQVQDLVQRFESANFQALELAGFYWGHQEEASPAYGSIIRATADYIHANHPDLEFLWIPYLNADGYEDWRQWGFDRASVQVGYAFGDRTTSRFQQADDGRLAHGMHGVEFEIPAGPTNPNIPGATDTERQLNNAVRYVSAGHHFNWANTELMTYYHANAILVYGKTSGELRQIYDRLYGFVSQHQRRSLARRVTIPVTRDTFTQHDPQYADVASGDAPALNLGTNLFGDTGNPSRVFLAFDDEGILTPGTLLAAHLEMQADYFPYGVAVSDVSLYVQDDPQWTEEMLTAQTEPDPGELSEIRRLRFHSEAATDYGWGVTDTVRRMREDRDTTVGFALRRRTEDPSERMVSLWSREGRGQSPSLVLVFDPTEETTGCPDSGEDVCPTSPDAGPSADTGAAGPSDGGNVDPADAARTDGGDQAAPDATNGTVDNPSDGCCSTTRNDRLPALPLFFVFVGLLALSRRTAGVG